MFNERGNHLKSSHIVDIRGYVDDFQSNRLHVLYVLKYNRRFHCPYDNLMLCYIVRKRFHMPF